MIFSSLGNVIILLVLVNFLIPVSFALELFYPFSRKICLKISNHVVNVIVETLFAILKTYKKFRLTFFQEKKAELPEQFIVLSNHQSLLDIPIFFSFFHGFEIRFVAKDSLSRHVPLVSPMLKSQGHCFIPRSGRAGLVMRRIDSFSKRCLDNKWNPVIFPEGTRSKDGTLGKFYSAGFRRIADSARLPIVVCVVDEGYKINDIRHIMENMNKVNYHAKILKIYPPALTKEEQVAILDEARDLMEKQLSEWRAEEPSNLKI